MSAPLTDDLPLTAKMHVLVAEIRRCIGDDELMTAHRKLDALDVLIGAAAEALAAASRRPQEPHGPVCIACGEANDGGYEVEDGPGPFCSGCWERLQEHFKAPDPSAAPPPWQPIETAPTMRRILVGGGGCNVCEVMFGRHGEWSAFMKPPTHWLPLPSPPASAPQHSVACKKNQKAFGINLCDGREVPASAPAPPEEP